MGWENLFDYMFSTLPNIRLGKDNFSPLHFKNIRQTLVCDKMHV